MDIAISRRAAAVLALAAVLGTAGWASAFAASGQPGPGPAQRQDTPVQAQAPKSRCQADSPLRNLLGAHLRASQPGAVNVVVAVPGPAVGRTNSSGPAPLRG